MRRQCSRKLKPPEGSFAEKEPQLPSFCSAGKANAPSLKLNNYDSCL